MHFLLPRQQLQVSGQIRIVAALSSHAQILPIYPLAGIPMIRSLRGLHNRSERGAEGQFLATMRLELQPLDRQTRSQSLYWIRRSDSRVKPKINGPLFWVTFNVVRKKDLTHFLYECVFLLTRIVPCNIHGPLPAGCHFYGNKPVPLPRWNKFAYLQEWPLISEAGNRKRTVSSDVANVNISKH
jgi:hypothetical protein